MSFVIYMIGAITASTAIGFLLGPATAFLVGGLLTLMAGLIFNL